MARNIKWYAPFKSLSGVDCVINIYDNDWPAGMKMALKAGANPFYFEEDISDDLLNGVLRFRTGYIRLADQDYNENIADIYPSAPFDRYVEVLYNNTVVFNGYIQVQNFTDELIPRPRIVEFPVISPLGLMDQKTFSNILFMPPSAVTLGSLLNTILTNTPYSAVYTPKNYGYPNVVDLSMPVSTLVPTPWNEDYHHSQNVDTMSKVMKGEKYSYIIEIICKAFGWICHDTPTALVFTAFDFEGDYCYYPVGHIGDNSYRYDAGISASAEALTNYFTPADKDANIQTLQPDTGIEIKYKNYPQTRNFDYKRTYVPDTNGVVIMPSFVPYQDQFPAHIEKFSMCNLIPVPVLNEFSSSLGPMTFDSNDKINIGQGCVAWYGHEGFMCSLGAYQTDHTLFWIRFYMRKRSGQKFSSSYDILGRQDGYIGGLAQNSDIDDYYIYTELDTSNSYYVQLTFKYRYNNASGSQYPQLPTQALIFIYNVQLIVCENSEPYSEYRYMPGTDSDFIPNSPTTAVSSTIEMPISLYRLNDYLIGSSVRSSKVTTYPYLFQPRKKLTSKFRLGTAPSFPHIRLYSYLSKKWRIIAQTFRPWDDEYELTMQGSELL